METVVRAHSERTSLPLLLSRSRSRVCVVSCAHDSTSAVGI